LFGKKGTIRSKWRSGSLLPHSFSDFPGAPYPGGFARPSRPDGSLWDADRGEWQGVHKRQNTAHGLWSAAVPCCSRGEQPDWRGGDDLTDRAASRAARSIHRPTCSHSWYSSHLRCKRQQWLVLESECDHQQFGSRQCELHSFPETGNVHDYDLESWLRHRNFHSDRNRGHFRGDGDFLGQLAIRAGDIDAAIATEKYKSRTRRRTEHPEWSSPSQTEAQAGC
jgi:hypothetical protein